MHWSCATWGLLFTVWYVYTHTATPSTVNDIIIGGMMRAIVDNTQLERSIDILKEISFSQVLTRLAAHIDVVN